ncbi:Protein of unknown function, partial [Gryllus bimaculatus]
TVHQHGVVTTKPQVSGLSRRRRLRFGRRSSRARTLWGQQRPPSGAAAAEAAPVAAAEAPSVASGRCFAPSRAAPGRAAPAGDVSPAPGSVPLRSAVQRSSTPAAARWRRRTLAAPLILADKSLMSLHAGTEECGNETAASVRFEVTSAEGLVTADGVREQE